MSSDKVKDVILKDEMESSYIDYAMSVVIGRAIPDVRDGLKPVHRKIIYAMVDNNYVYNRPHVKSARTVGECFSKGTLINTSTGLTKIEDIKLGDSVYTHNGLNKVIKLFEMPKQLIYKVELENGLINYCTKGQKFKVLTKNIEYIWKTAKNLTNDDYIVCRSISPDLKSYKKLDENLIFDEEIAYFLGLFLADGWIDRDNKRGYHRIAIASESKSVIKRLREIFKSKFNIDENFHQKDDTIYYIKINNSNLSSKIINLFELKNKYSHNIDIPDIVYQSPKSVFFSFLSGFIEGDGHIHKNRNVISIHSISENFIKKLQILLFSYNFQSARYRQDKKEHLYKGRMIKGNHSIHSLEIRGIDYITIRNHLVLYNPKKKKRLLNNSKVIPSKFEEIPYIGKYIFDEFSEKHIGGGWYSNKDGKKIRAGIKYNNGTKIRYTKNLAEKIRIYKSTLNSLGILNKMEKIDSKYLEFINTILEKNLNFIKIKNLKTINEEKTFDIQVSDHHQFIANGMLSHNCLGKYHPHGDMAVYNAMVRMGQDFSLRYPLIDPQGNFGSVDGDPPAAMRYTESRLAQITNEIFEDLNKDTVEFQPNFDDSLQEPKVMPSKLPNMLINGTKGIAVGMATSMPPHNLTEICNGIIATIDNPDISLEELMDYVKGPDFPTGGIITNTDGIYNAYSTGQGSIPVYGKVEVEQKGKNFNLIISEIPYLLNKASLLESIAALIKDGVLKDIRDLRDESDRNGMRIVLELKKDAQPAIIKNILFKRTRLLTKFNVINLVLVNDGKQPKILTLKELIQEYINHRLTIIVRRTEYDLTKAKDRLHIVEGLLIALNDIDKVIAIIKSAKDTEDAKIKLIDAYKLSEIQVKAILSMPLSRLTNLEQQKLVDEQDALKVKIKELENILENKSVRLSIIKDELMDLIKKYGDPRKTEILESKKLDTDIEKKDLVKKEPTIVLLTKNHYIKRMLPQQYRAQARGGRGKKGMTIRDEDFIQDLFVASTHDTILFFTNKGRVYTKKCFEIPLQQRTAKGKPIVNFLPLKVNEDISEMIPIHNFDTIEMLIMVTKNGIVKKTPLNLFSKILKTGIRAQKIRDDDQLVSVKKLSNELQDIFLATKQGYAIRFDETELRELGRNTMGVKGADLRKNDEVIGCLLVTDEENILTLTSNGKGQRTRIEEYRKTGRGAKGVINMTLDEGDEVIALKLAEDQDLLIGTEQGQVIRTPIEDIRLTHRRSKGVRVIKLYKGDSVVAIGSCAKSGED